jgi:hypothetical protein
MMNDENRRDSRWWLARGADIHPIICRIMRRLHEEQEPRRKQLLLARDLFGNFPALGLEPGEAVRPRSIDYERLGLNIIRAVATTAHANSVQGPPPRAAFITTDGDYDLRRRAKGMQKFCAGTIAQTKFDRIARRVKLQSAVFGDGLVKVYDAWGKPVVERRFPWEVIVDDQDAHYDNPRSMYERKRSDKTCLAERFPRHRRAIMEANAPENIGGAMTLADSVEVYEAWHLPSGPDAGDGKHVIVINGATLLEEDWNDEFPFARLQWSDPLAGYWADGVAAELAGLQLELNMLLAKSRLCLHLIANPRVLAEAGSIVKSHVNNQIGSIVEYRRGSRPPIFDIARAVAPELYDQMDRIWSKAFQLSGVNELAVNAQIPAGFKSGRAQLVFANQQSQRFADWEKGGQELYLDVSRLLVRVMRRLAEDDPDVEVVYHDARRKRIERIPWRSIDLDESSYLMTIQAMSSLPNDPAGRAEILDQWLSAGVIDMPTYRRQVEAPDMEMENALESAPHDLIEEGLERMVYGEDGDDYQLHPEGYFPLELCMKMGLAYLLRAQLDGVAEEQLTKLRLFLDETKDLMDAAQSASAGPPPGMPPGPPPPDAPMPPDPGAGAPPPPMPAEQAA